MMNPLQPRALPNCARPDDRVDARTAIAILLLSLVGCQASPPPATTPAPTAKPTPAPSAPVAATAPASTPAAAAKRASVAMPSMELPPGPIYVCETRGARVPIEYTEGVEKLCRRHPEMGPCQYERDACRGAGGRVFTSKGEEVTKAVEAAYDEKVHRVRFQADGGGSTAKK